MRIGQTVIGGNNPIAVQSMTNTATADIEASVAQIERIADAGAPIVRLTAQGKREGEALRDIVAKVREEGYPTAIVADIHFVPEIASIAAESVDKVRINPGNYRTNGGELEALIEKCRKRGVALRIGVNHGSLAKHIVDKLGDTPAGMVESAMEFLRICVRENFDQVVVSMKSSNTRVMVHAYRLLVEAMEREQMSFPIHLGVTEAGNGIEGRIKSAVGIGALLADGIGDTIRVSLTDDPVREVYAAKHILRACGLDEEFVEVVACPTCGRCEWESMSLANKVTEFVRPYNKRAKIAVMGCVVNGPGEARDADLGIAGGKGSCLIFKKGEPYKKVAAEHAEEEFIKEVGLLLDGE